jgi:hypothetical protein
MNISRGRTEAAVAYKTRQDALDKHIRIASVAHTLLGKMVDGPRGDLVLGALYGAMASRTRPVYRVPDSSEAVRRSLQRSVALSIAAVHSDFEWACRDLLTDALEFWESRWTPNLGQVQAPPPLGTVLGKRGWSGSVSEVLRSRSANSNFVDACYSLLGISTHKDALVFLPLFDFFRRCRNRILHQDGSAGGDLVAFAQTHSVQDAFKALPGSVRRMTPELPSLVSSETIELFPEHAILFLIVARRLFDSLASRIRSELDYDGYLRMVAHYAYGVADHTFRGKFNKNVEQEGRRFLRVRYQVMGPTKERLIADLKRLGLWPEIVERSHQLGSQAKVTGL